MGFFEAIRRAVRVIKRSSVLISNILRVKKNAGRMITLHWAFRHLHIYASNCKIAINTKYLGDVHVYVYGGNHQLIIEEGCVIKSGIIWFEDRDCEIRVSKNTTIEEAHLSAAEDGRKLIIGDDCMISRGVFVSTTDSHSIISLQDNRRTNFGADVVLGNHVWVGRNVSIHKGVTVGNNSVLAEHSVITKDVPCNSIAAGSPARIVRSGIIWDRERV